jgi:hypothetical protein
VALTEEQRTMLQLLLSGQSYDDIGSLLGVGADEVRSRARSALQEIGGADPDAQVGLSDYLLGQADPIGRADAVRHLQADPESNALAQRLVQNLRLLAPNAELPEVPEARGGRKAPAPPPPAPATPPPAVPPAPGAPAPSPTQQGPGFAHRVAGAFSGLRGLSGKRRTQFLVGLAGVLTLLIVGVVLASSGGDDDGGGDCQEVDTQAAQQAGVPTIKLAATGASADADCPPSGQITLGATQQATNSQNQTTPTFALQANAVNLPPSADGERYLLWLYQSDTQSLPLGQETVDDSGNLTGGVPLIAQQVLLLPAFDSIRISKVSAAEAQTVQQSLQQQQQGKNATGVVQFVGQPVLQGSIAELGLDQLLQQAQQQAGAGAQAPQSGGKPPQG